MSTVTSAEYYPFESVRSRVSWGALLAGAAVAMGVHSMLMLLGVAIGITASDEVDQGTIGAGAGVWAFISLCLSMFLGGWVATQCTVGENRTEAVLYGIVVWAVTSVLLVTLAATYLRVGLDLAASHRMSAAGTGVSAQEGNNAVRSASDVTRQPTAYRDRDETMKASWWAFAASFVSMLAAVGGAMVGPIELSIRREPRTSYGRTSQPRPSA